MAAGFVMLAFVLTEHKPRQAPVPEPPMRTGVLQPDESETVEYTVRDDGGIVYTTSSSADQEPLRQHCQEKGGVFNECGATGTPAAVCAFTCEFVESISEIDTSDWIEYRNEKFGFTFKYPEVFFNSFESGDEGIFLLGDTPGVERMEVFYYEPLEGDITQTQEIDKIIAQKGELRRSHLIRETENPKLYHFYKERGGFIVEDIIIVDDRTKNIVMFVIERTPDTDFPVDQILSTFEFIEPAVGFTAEDGVLTFSAPNLSYRIRYDAALVPEATAFRDERQGIDLPIDDIRSISIERRDPSSWQGNFTCDQLLGLYLDTVSIGTVLLGDISASEFILPEGYCDGGSGCSEPIRAISFCESKARHDFVLVGYDDAAANAQFDAMLTSFEFIDQ